MRRIWGIFVALITAFILLSGCSFIDNEVTQETGQAILPEAVPVDESGEDVSFEEWAKGLFDKFTSSQENKQQDTSKDTVESENERPDELDSVAIEHTGFELVTVERVIDGDTVELADGSKVRFIGINTPESTNTIEQFGKEASDYTKRRLEGKQIYIQKDVSETDKYGRLLRYIWLEIPSDDMDEQEIRTKMFNAELILNGYAEPYPFPPDVKYKDYFEKFAREAREQGLGLWGLKDR